MRTGRIIKIEHHKDRGIIRDENREEIGYRLRSPFPSLRVGQKVAFEIFLTAQGLTAVVLELLS